jgi:hypothetical protein
MDILEAILKLLAQGLSPALRSLLVTLVENWASFAKQTATPVDDIVVTALKVLLGVPTP